LADADAPIRVERCGDVAVIVIDNPPVNALSQAVRQGLMEAVATIEGDSSVTAAIITGAGRLFSAGSDIREFDAPPLTPDVLEVCAAIEGSAKPVVAAIRGTALGGGLELAMACHARLFAHGASAGLPEVRLGLIGGTQRLPRLVDATAALEMIVSGRSVSAARARALGLADAVAPAEGLREAAVVQARRLAREGVRRTGALPVRLADRAAFDAAAAKARARARGQHSIEAAVEAVASALEVPFEEGLAHEHARFMELRRSVQARALRHLFFAERAAGSPRQLAAEPRPVETVGILGAGTMGAGIAAICIAAGFRAILAEPSAEARERAKGRIAAHLDSQVAAGELLPEDAEARRVALLIANDAAALAAADLVIEAVSEDMEVKQAALRELGRLLRPGAVIASNTSYLDLVLLAEAAGRPQDAIGLHFFAPPERMRLVELVRHDRAAPDALATGLALARRLGKLPVVVGASEGFVGNRILAMWRREMEYALEDGALPHEVDAALEAYGFPMGPFAVADLSGLDIAWARRKQLAARRPPQERYLEVADRLCEMGRLGRKTGAGWYRYEGSERRPDPEVAALIAAARAARGLTPRPVPAVEIQHRALAAIVNEAAKLLEEGVAARPGDIDLVLVHGYGFPAWRGGPLYAADRIGAAAILAEVEKLHAANGPGFEPAPLLRRLAAAGEGFHAPAATPAALLTLRLDRLATFAC
jgi:3-hydroxyacyl-CoA dehydrogenase